MLFPSQFAPLEVANCGKVRVSIHFFDYLLRYISLSVDDCVIVQPDYMLTRWTMSHPAGVNWLNQNLVMDIFGAHYGRNPSPKIVDQENPSSLQNQLWRSQILWSLALDHEECFGTLETVKVVFDRMCDYKIIITQQLLYYAHASENRRYFEAAFAGE